MFKINRKPTSPGSILQEEFIKPLGLTQKQLAKHLDCDIKVVNRIINGRCAVTAEIALKLAATFKTTPDFWLNAQKAIDIYNAAKKVKRLPKRMFTL